MLLSDNFQDSLQAARQLDEMNTERQKIERDIVKEAEAQVEERYKDSQGVVSLNHSWASWCSWYCREPAYKHPEKTRNCSWRRGIGKGSGRSIPGLDLVKALNNCSDLLSEFGGHPMAVGLSLDQANIEKFRTAFNEAVRNLIGDEVVEPT